MPRVPCLVSPWSARHAEILLRSLILTGHREITARFMEHRLAWTLAACTRILWPMVRLALAIGLNTST